jgi:hypothetical protein
MYWPRRCCGSLGPVVSRWVKEAKGQVIERKQLIVMTAGNGFGHQGMERNSELLTTRVASPNDWDVPAVLAPLAPYKDKLTVCRPFHNPFGENLHGNGWGTLTCMTPVSSSPGGVSLDRWVGLGLGADDAFPSIALGVADKPDRAPPCTSADGPRQPFPAIGSPIDAYDSIFGVGKAGVDASKILAADRSLLDHLAEDITSAQGQLANPERAKLEQLLTSFRGLEQQLAKKQAAFAVRQPPAAPASDLPKSGLHRDVIRAHSSLLVAAMAFELTHVAHLSLLGFDAHNQGWGMLDIPGDAHESLMHKKIAGWTDEQYDKAVADILRFEAAELAYIWESLAQFQLAGKPASENTLMAWVNSGGGKHHDGASWHPVIMLGNAGGALRSGQYLEYKPGGARDQRCFPHHRQRGRNAGNEPLVTRRAAKAAERAS